MFDRALVRQQRPDGRKRDADVDAYLTCARRIFARVHPWRRRGRQPQAERSQQQGRADLSKDEASLRGFEAKPKLEDADPFGELALARPGPPAPGPPARYSAACQGADREGPKPPLSTGMRRDDQARLGRIGRTRQAQQPRKDTGGQAAAVLNPEAAMGANRRLSSSERSGPAPQAAATRSPGGARRARAERPRQD